MKHTFLLFLKPVSGCDMLLIVIGCLRFTSFCWVGKLINIITKPTNSPTQPNKKIGLKVVFGPLFSQRKYYFVDWDWFIQETDRPQYKKANPTNLSANILIRGTIVIRTHDMHKNLYITQFCLTKPGPDYYAPP